MHPEVFRCGNHNATNFKAVWWSVSEKTHFQAKTSLSFAFRGSTSTHPKVFRHADHNGTNFKAVWWSISEKTRGPNSEHPEVFSHTNHNITSFKAVWWSISEKTHFRLKHHLPLYFKGQNQCTQRFSDMLITMVQISKLYDNPFLRKQEDQTQWTSGFQSCQSQWYTF